MTRVCLSANIPSCPCLLHFWRNFDCLGVNFQQPTPHSLILCQKKFRFFTFASADSSTCTVFALSYLGEIYWQAMFLQISIKSWLGQGLQGLHTGQGLEVGDQLRL